MATAKKRAKSAATAKTATAKTAKPPAFAAAVREAMAAALPGYRLVDVGRGSGPVVTFERPTAGLPGLRETVAFQKGLHGADWLRVNLLVSFVAQGAGGEPRELELAEGATLGRDVAFTASTLQAVLAEAAGSLESRAAAVYAPFEAAHARLAALFGHLAEHYLAWRRDVGSRLPPAAFEDDGSGLSPAIASFHAAVSGLAEGLPGDVATALARYWHAGRPMRREDYAADDHYDCARCTAFVAFKKGKLVEVPDPLAGVHVAFVCAKH